MGTIHDDILNCRACKLWGHYRQTVPFEGNLNSKIVFVGRDPGEVEVEQLRPFVGPAGVVLREDVLGGIGHEPSLFYISNIVCCRPFKNIPPNSQEAAFCADRHVARAIAEIKPKVVVSLGKEAVEWVTGKTFQSIGAIRGKRFSYRYCGDIVVIPTWHPSYVLRLRENTPAQSDRRLNEMQQDILCAIGIANEN